MTMSDYCVIGSGPAGVAAAFALAREGRSVTMLDAGHTLEPARSAVVSRLGAAPPAAWQPAEIGVLKEGMQATARGIPLKRLYGSDYPFAPPAGAQEIECRRAELRPSFAQGGLSTVWGAGVLPFHQDDMHDWPFPASTLDPHYRAVFEFLPCAAVRDGLEELFPVHAATPQPLEGSQQAKTFLADLQRSAPRLRAQGIHFGRSRLAVDTGAGRPDRPACQYCGMCLYGCPYGVIWNAAYTLRELQRRPGFRYVADFVVEDLRESGNEVVIRGRHRVTGAARQHRAGRVLLGAGVVSSTALLLASMDAFGHRLRLQDSMYFLLPLLRFAGSAGLEQERLHTLAQAFLVLRDKAVCDELVHLSVYTWNDLMEPSLRAAGGPLGRTAGRLWRALGARMLVCGGYLHSRHSPGIWMQLDKQPGGGSRISLEGEQDVAARRIVRKVGHKLLRSTAALKALPLTPLAQRPPPGRGFHVGGSFPMGTAAAPWRCDTEGRPHGFSRLHLVDASCLPSIPASTITLPVMANAHRIATLAARRGVA